MTAATPPTPGASTDDATPELRRAALAALATADPAAKLDATARLAAIARVDATALLQAPCPLPGRPARPRLVAPGAVERRDVKTPTGRAALLHALAHIEFNAINLALDAVWRFGGMPDDYYRDWARVAIEEAGHFALLAARLASLGRAYGDFVAHDGLWEMARKTADDVLARMALVPRTLEARGLDASPAVAAKFAAVGDADSCAVVERILRDEIGHVAIGNRWFRHECERRGESPQAAYDRLARAYGAPRLRGPFNVDARRAAGFDDDEIAALLGASNPG